MGFFLAWLAIGKIKVTQLAFRGASETVKVLLTVAQSLRNACCYVTDQLREKVDSWRRSLKVGWEAFGKKQRCHETDLLHTAASVGLPGRSQPVSWCGEQKRIRGTVTELQATTLPSPPLCPTTSEASTRPGKYFQGGGTEPTPWKPKNTWQTTRNLWSFNALLRTWPFSDGRQLTVEVFWVVFDLPNNRKKMRMKRTWIHSPTVTFTNPRCLPVW